MNFLHPQSQKKKLGSIIKLWLLSPAQQPSSMRAAACAQGFIFINT
jgi:hypothetical protein